MISNPCFRPRPLSPTTSFCSDSCRLIIENSEDHYHERVLDVINRQMQRLLLAHSVVGKDVIMTQLNEKVLPLASNVPKNLSKERSNCLLGRLQQRMENAKTPPLETTIKTKTTTSQNTTTTSSANTTTADTDLQKKTTTRYKTELCRSFSETGGNCRYGGKCQFAHGEQELRSLAAVRHPKYKTELCRTYHETGLCQYGLRCNFIHSSIGDDGRPDFADDLVVTGDKKGVGEMDKSQDTKVTMWDIMSPYSTGRRSVAIMSKEGQNGRFCEKRKRAERRCGEIRLRNLVTTFRARNHSSYSGPQYGSYRVGTKFCCDETIHGSEAGRELRDRSLDLDHADIVGHSHVDVVLIESVHNTNIRMNNLGENFHNHLTIYES